MKKKIVIISSYYPPDLGPGAIRAESITNLILEQFPSSSIEIITTVPHRYSKVSLGNKQNNQKIILHRVSVPFTSVGFIYQIINYIFFLLFSLSHIFKKKDIIIVTTSKFGSGLIACILKIIWKSILIVDVRDMPSKLLQEQFGSKFIRLAYDYCENFVLSRTDHIIVNSPGFLPIMKARFVHKEISLITHGVDNDLFNEPKKNHHNINSPKLLYAGNVGLGQNIHSIVPCIAKRLKNVQIDIFGDGKFLQKLINDCNKLQLNNVNFYRPIDRRDLFKKYNEYDVLFLNLNTLEGLELVLPSKIFEYLASGLTIIMGLHGASYEYVKALKLKNVFLFRSNDCEDFIFQYSLALKMGLKRVDRSKLRNRYCRKKIIRNSLLPILKNIYN